MAHKQDVLELFADEHREAERLIAAREATRDDERRTALVRTLVAWVLRHCAAEEHHLHPALRRTVPGGDRLVATALARRAGVEHTVARLEAAPPGSAGYERAVCELTDWVLEHADREEAEVFPPLRRALTRHERFALGTAAEHAARGPLDPGPLARLRDKLRDRPKK